jgi:hypothetical protein
MFSVFGNASVPTHCTDGHLSLDAVGKVADLSLGAVCVCTVQTRLYGVGIVACDTLKPCLQPISSLSSDAAE